MIPEQNIIYDTYCVHPSCLASQCAFFVYHDQSIHVVEEHPIKMIHPLQLSSVYSKLAQKEKVVLEKGKNTLEGNVGKYIDRFCEKMAEFMKKSYLNGYKDIVRAEVAKFKISDVHQVCAKLRKGDYKMLQEILDSEKKQSGQDDEQTRIYLESKIGQIDKNINKRIEELYEAFEKIFMVTFENWQDFVKIAFGNIDDISKENMQEVKKLVSNSIGYDLSSEELPTIGKTPSRVSSIQDSFQLHDKDKKDKNKTHKIRKPQKEKVVQKKSTNKPTVLKSVSNSVQKPSSPFKPFMVDSNMYRNVIEIAHLQIRVNNCHSPEQAFEYITSRYKSLKGIHIFYHQFAKKQWLEKIIHQYPMIKQITLNCSHEFDYSLLFGFPRQSWDNIQNIDLRWDMDRFFSDYHIYKFFPAKKKQLMQNLKPVNFPAKCYKYLKNNRSLSLSNQKMIDIFLSLQDFTFTNIRTFHCYKPYDEKMPTMAKLYTMISHKLTNLLHLDFSEVNIGESELQFRQFIKSNLCLTSIKLYYCIIKKKNVGGVFQALEVLPNLTKLYVVWNSQHQNMGEIMPQAFLCHQNLQELYIENFLLKGNSQQNYGKPDFSKLSQLTKLTRLSFNTCFPVQTNFMDNFSQQTLANIRYLNLGLTDIDNDFMDYFPRMLQLTYLDIDRTQITGDAFLEACRSFYMSNNASYPLLRYLNMEFWNKNKNNELTYRFSFEQMKQIGHYLRDLKYIEITGCKNLIYYNFAQFKNLKCIAMSSEMAKKMVHLPPTVQIFVIDEDSS